MTSSTDNDVTTNGASATLAATQRALDGAVNPSTRAAIERATRLMSSPALDSATGQVMRAFQQLEARHRALTSQALGAFADALPSYELATGATKVMQDALDLKVGASKVLQDALGTRFMLSALGHLTGLVDRDRALLGSGGAVAEWSQRLNGILGPRPEWAERHAQTLGHIDLGGAYGARLSGLAAWRPQSAAFDNLLTSRIPAGLVTPRVAPLLRDPHDGSQPDRAFQPRGEARTVADLTRDIDLKAVVGDSDEFVEQLVCSRRQDVDERPVRPARLDHVGTLSNIATMLMTAALVSTDPRVQKAAMQMIERLQAIIRSLGG